MVLLDGTVKSGNLVKLRVISGHIEAFNLVNIWSTNAKRFIVLWEEAMP